MAKRANTVAALKEENRILRSEIKRLSRTLRAYSAEDTSSKRGKRKSFERVLLHEQKKALALASGSYAKYVASRFTRATFYGIFKKISGGFRKFRLVSTAMRVISSAVTFIGAGAFFIFLSGIALFFIPVAAIFCLGVYLASMLFRKRSFRELEKRLGNKDIFVFFPQGERPFERDSCFADTLSKMQSKHSFTVIVSPYFISAKGFGGRGYYQILRFENENVCLIRRHAFFALRRRLLGKRSEKTTYIY